MKALDKIASFRFRKNTVLTAKELNMLVFAIRALHRAVKKKARTK